MPLLIFLTLLTAATTINDVDTAATLKRAQLPPYTGPGQLLEGAKPQPKLPHYTPNETCPLIVIQPNQQIGTLDDCIRSEQAAYDRLKVEWPTLRPDIQANCAWLAQLLVPAYTFLAICVDQAPPPDMPWSGPTDPFRY